MKLLYYLVRILGLGALGLGIISVKPSHTTQLPMLYIQGNEIRRKDTQRPVILRGVISDYFRYTGIIADPSIARAGGIANEIRKTDEFRAAGLNVVGFYLSDYQKVKKNISELDTYIMFAKKSGIYVYLQPVARDFEGSRSGSKDSFADLSELMNFFSVRYKDDVNVLYGLGAEPEITDESFVTWSVKQQLLATIVRQNNPQAILLVSSPGRRFDDYIAAEPFLFDNVLYFSTGYTSNDDKGAWLHPDVVQKRILTAVDPISNGRYPVFVGEFGGNYGADFSSDTDIGIIKTIIKRLCLRNRSFTFYKMSPFYGNDSQSIFDEKGKITKRGTMFMNELRKCPGTNFISDTIKP